LSNPSEGRYLRPAHEWLKLEPFVKVCGCYSVYFLTLSDSYQLHLHIKTCVTLASIGNNQIFSYLAMVIGIAYLLIPAILE
jgi:hypothetical protein